MNQGRTKGEAWSIKKKKKKKERKYVKKMFSFEWFVLVLQCDAFVVIVLSDEPRPNLGRGFGRPPNNFIVDVLRRLFRFGSCDSEKRILFGV